MERMPWPEMSERFVLLSGLLGFLKAKFRHRNGVETDVKEMETG